MSLLQNEDFVIYQLRTSYLAQIHDGVGERLININSAFLSDPAFRAAGWTSKTTEWQRTYSPPIPTAVTSDYFQARPASRAIASSSPLEDDDEAGMVTGGGIGSDDTVGPAHALRRRRRREHLEEDDSSDLSDESDEEVEDAQRPANQVHFGKMPDRPRAGSSPIRTSAQLNGPSLLVTSPSRPSEKGRLRNNSLSAVESTRARARTDTTTSSEISSENGLDPSIFTRKQINLERSRRGRNTLAEHIDLEQQETTEVHNSDGEDDDPESDDSSLASGFLGTGESPSLLEDVDASPPLSSLAGVRLPPPASSKNLSPKKTKQAPVTWSNLPPQRPISTIQPVSALAMALKARNRKPVSPLERFATLSGTGDPNPLYMKIYVPSSAQPSKPFELILRRFSDEGVAVTVAQAIGFSLWQYAENKIEPHIDDTKMNVNSWTFRIVEDGEVDFDFPALSRVRPMSDFTSNNNRPTRARMREKPWDEFALVEATEIQFTENENLTPMYSEEAPAVHKDLANEGSSSDTTAQQPVPELAVEVQEDSITGPRLITEPFRKTVLNAMDAPVPTVAHATPHTGAVKTLKIHYLDYDLNPRTIPLEVTTDTYLAEVFDRVCKLISVDKALFTLKVTGTNSVAPTDRTVEALGSERSSLDLTRRRFIGDGTFGPSGSPGSSSPNAPLLLTTSGTAKKTRRGGMLHPLTQHSDVLPLGIAGGITASYRRYQVTRKQPMSFAPSHQRTLALDGEYMHIMPSDSGKDRIADAAQGKTTTVHFSNVVGCKVSRRHPKTFRVVVFRERETKRYDFEAISVTEAAEIVEEIKKGIERFRATMNI